jgi:hypothetical protein
MMRAFYMDADSLKFFYKVSSEPNYDYFQFKLNDTEVLRISGETLWEKKTVAVPAGYNKMEWTYKKDNSVSQGADCALIDLIDFTHTAPVKYIQRDLEVARIVSPLQKEAFGQEPVIVKVLNDGADTINEFNLAFVVNNKFPVLQNFKTELVPYGDSVTITFDRRADLDLNGLYDVTVYGYDNSDDYVYNDTLIVSLENTEIEESVRLFPNPFTNEINVLINSKSDKTIRVILTDVSGKERISLEQQLSEGGNTILLDTRKLSPALYILNIRGLNFSKAFPLVKVRQ